MPLQKARKTVQLYGGISDNADSFVVQPPAVEYCENAHWRGKDGVLRKRLGSYGSTLTGIPTATEPPTVLHAIGDKLYTFTQDKSYSYDVETDTWSNITQGARFSSASVLGRSQTNNGVTCASIFKTTTRTWFAYTVKKTASDPTGIQGVFASFVVTLDSDGSVINSVEITPHTSAGGTPPSVGPVAPKLVPYGSDVAVVYADASNLTSGANALYRRKVNDNGTLGTATRIVDDIYCEGIFPFGTGYYNYNSIQDPRGVTSGFPFYEVRAMRYGITHLTGVNNILAVTDSAGDIQILESDDGFATTTHSLALAAPANYYLKPLGVAGTGTDYAILYAEKHATNVGLDIKIISLPYGSTTALAANWVKSGVVSAATSVAVNGALQYDESELFLQYAVGTITMSTTTYDSTPSTNIGTVTASAGTAVTNKALTGHRVVSGYQELDGKTFVATQIWAIPGVELAQDNDDAPDAYDGYLRPTTTVLLDVSTPTQPIVAAQFDALQSKHTDFSEAMNNQHVPDLLVDPASSEDTLVIANREVFTAESVYGTKESINDTRFETVAASARINIHKLTFTETAALPGVSLGDGLVIPGGLPLWFDGDTLCELSPIAAPEIMEFTDNAVGAAKIGFGYKQYTTGRTAANYRSMQAVVGFTDSHGNVHRSAPSTTMQVYGLVPVNSGPTPYEHGWDVDLEIAVPFSANPGRNQERYFVELYISDTSTSTPRLAKRENIDPYSGYVTVNFRNSARPSGSADSTSIPMTRTSPFIYTNGEVLAADPWLNFTHVVATSNRLWAISAEDVGQVYYSKLFEEFVSPEFNAALVVSLGDERKLTAIGTLDDKVIVFEKHGIHAIYGPGPDNTGSTGRTGGFEVHRVTSDVGCDDPASVVETSRGLIFKSRRGFYLLDRGLQLTFIGGGVQNITRNTYVRTAQLVPEFAEIRFHLAVEDGKTQVPELGPTPQDITPGRPPRPKYGNVLPSSGCVVYNYEWDRWTVFSNYPARATTLTSDGRYARITGGWVIFVEAPEEDDVWRDGSQAYSMKVLTPPIPLDSIEGYGRVRRITALGRYMSSWALDAYSDTMAGDIQITPYYDYEAAAGSDVKLWRANVDLQGGADRLQIVMRPKRQKCQAIQLLIEEVATTPYYVGETADYSLGRGFEITALDLDIGVKQGPVRTLGANRKK